MSDQERCPRIEPLSALIDGELDAAQRAAVQAHAAGCPLCGPMLADMRRLHEGFARLPRSLPAFDVAAEVDRRIAPAAAPGRALRPARRRWWQVAVLAPGGAMAVAAGLWLGAALVPMAGSATASQIAAFSAAPPGALCPATNACARISP